LELPAVVIEQSVNNAGTEGGVAAPTLAGDGNKWWVHLVGSRLHSAHFCVWVHEEQYRASVQLIQQKALTRSGLASSMVVQPGEPFRLIGHSIAVLSPIWPSAIEGSQPLMAPSGTAADPRRF
jgi:hypothetical protein